jgi:heme-binding protein
MKFLIGTGAFVIAGAGLLGGAATASAEPPPRPPNCTAADLAGVSAGVAAATSVYLFTHPEVNDFFTNLQGRERSEVPGVVREYFDSRPEVESEIRGIRQPLVDLRNRCELTAMNGPM